MLAIRHLVPLALALALGAEGCASAPRTGSAESAGAPDPAEIVPLFGTTRVKRYRLPNGLRILVVENSTSPTFAYQTWFRVGSRDETPQYTGLAHLFEHMMFKQTKSLKEGEFDRILEGAGAEGENASTSRDWTSYVEEMPLGKTPTENLDLVMKLEAERLQNLVINEEAFKTEREVVQNERRFRNENSPDGTLYQAIYETAFTTHSYRWPVIGYQEDLDRMKGEDAQKFYRTFYAPNRATVVVVGNVRGVDVLALARKRYGGIPAAAEPAAPPVIPEEPPQREIRRKTMPLNTQVEKLVLAYHVPSVLHEDNAALGILQAILTGGQSSRLNRALVDTGIASSVDSYAPDGKDPSLFIFWVNLQKGRRAAEAETALLRELKQIGERAVGASELERARNRVEFEFFQGLEGGMGTAQFLGFFETIAGDFSVGLRQREAYQRVTPAEAQAVARKYFVPESRTVLVGVPK